MTDICPICCNPRDSAERIEKLEAALKRLGDYEEFTPFDTWSELDARIKYARKALGEKS